MAKEPKFTIMQDVDKLGPVYLLIADNHVVAVVANKEFAEFLTIQLNLLCTPNEENTASPVDQNQEKVEDHSQSQEVVSVYDDFIKPNFNKNEKYL